MTQSYLFGFAPLERSLCHVFLNHLFQAFNLFKKWGKFEAENLKCYGDNI